MVVVPSRTRIIWTPSSTHRPRPLRTRRFPRSLWYSPLSPPRPLNLTVVRSHFFFSFFFWEAGISLERCSSHAYPKAASDETSSFVAVGSSQGDITVFFAAPPPVTVSIPAPRHLDPRFWMCRSCTSTPTSPTSPSSAPSELTKEVRNTRKGKLVVDPVLTGVSQLAFVSNTCFVSVGKGGKTLIWTVNGSCIGLFGSHSWDLSNPVTQ